MNFKRKLNLEEKVTKAAEFQMELNGSVNILDIFSQIRWLENAHLQRWQQGEYSFLEENMQSTPEKRRQVLKLFSDWAQKLQFIEAPRSFHSQIAADFALEIFINESDQERQLLSRHYLAPDLSSRKKVNLQKKLVARPDIQVFIHSSKENLSCQSCNTPIERDSYYYTELQKDYCLTCLQLEHLSFLASGDVALSRRAKKYSKKFAAVVEYNNKRRRYERRGLLVEKKALEAAELECQNDAEARAKNKQKNTVRRQQEDFNFTIEFTKKIKELFPGCPESEIDAIAEHATERGSGRVGRTAAAKKLHEENIRLAVIAYIRHKHTFYDRLLLNRTPKKTCRKLIQPALQKKLQSWELP